MARYTGPACKRCRREGIKLFLKGERCLQDGKCALVRREKAPGQHGANSKKPKEYGMQLREKQRAKRYYGVLENQFKNYFYIADKQPGVTGENLLRLLERRLDNTVYRIGLAESRAEARQLVLHGHFTLNGKKVSSPALQVKVGDEIAVAENSKNNAKIKEEIEALDRRDAPKWISVDKSKVTSKIVALPARDDIEFPFEEHLIVEFYSR